LTSSPEHYGYHDLPHKKVIISKARPRIAFIIRTAVRYVAKRYPRFARYASLLRALQQRCYSHSKGIFSACLAPTLWVLFVRQRESSDGRVLRRRTLSARQCVILPFAVCTVKDVNGTAPAYFLSLPCANCMSTTSTSRNRNRFLGVAK